MDKSATAQNQVRNVVWHGWLADRLRPSVSFQTIFLNSIRQIFNFLLLCDCHWLIRYPHIRSHPLYIFVRIVSANMEKLQRKRVCLPDYLKIGLCCVTGHGQRCFQCRLSISTWIGELDEKDGRRVTTTRWRKLEPSKIVCLPSNICQLQKKKHLNRIP